MLIWLPIVDNMISSLIDFLEGNYRIKILNVLNPPIVSF